MLQCQNRYRIFTVGRSDVELWAEMYIFKNPAWIETSLLSTTRFEDLTDSIFYDINKNLGTLQQGDPLVSVVIPAFNEELNILKAVYTLSRNVAPFPVEIIVVNNNSTDRTGEVLKRLGVQTVFQPKQGCGPARQLGQERARGKYVLMADADCLYPPDWIRRMTTALQQANVACVYGRYSFIGSMEKPRWKFFVYELIRDFYAEFRHVKRPFMNALGMNMGYVRDLGLKVGFIDRHIRGEDGRMCFALMQHGKIKQVRDRAVRVWTSPRTLDREGRLFYSLAARMAVELTRFGHYFTRQKAHDVHTSENYDPRALKHFRKYRSIHKNKEPI